MRELSRCIECTGEICLEFVEGNRITEEFCRSSARRALSKCQFAQEELLEF
jgi:hypothetical protein